MSEVKSFFWYDYETSGRDFVRDRVMQFGGLRTDADLNPLGEPLTLYCKLSLDILPEPGACLIHGLSPQRVERDGVDEPQFAERVLEEFARPGTCVCGYNNIGFDDHFTRHLLFRNFHSPYEHEWRNDNSRWDLIDVMRLWRATRPEGLQWPTDAEARPSFRLGALAEANGIALDAHDAPSDVMATAELARRLRAAQPKLFAYALRLRRRREAAATLLPLIGEPILHVAKYYGNARGCVAPLLPLWSDGADADKAREALGVDLAVEPEECLRLLADPEAAAEEGRSAPVSLLRLNQCPMFVKAEGMLDDAVAERIGMDLDVCRRNLRAYLERADEVRQALIDWRAARRAPERRAPDCESLYSGLPEDADLRRFAEVRAAGGRGDWRFMDSRLSELWFRYRARHYGDNLNDLEKERWEEYRCRRLSDADAGGSLTLDDYLEQLREMRENPELSRHEPLLRELEEWADVVAA